MDKNLHERALEIQKLAIDTWSEELQKRYSPEQLAKRIFEHEIK
jgi:hypothetical protein